MTSRIRTWMAGQGWRRRPVSEAVAGEMAKTTRDAIDTRDDLPGVDELPSESFGEVTVNPLFVGHLIY